MFFAPVKKSRGKKQVSLWSQSLTKGNILKSFTFEAAHHLFNMKVTTITRLYLPSSDCSAVYADEWYNYDFGDLKLIYMTI